MKLTKEEFLRKIREDLSALTEEELRNAEKYYDEYFADKQDDEPEIGSYGDDSSNEADEVKTESDTAKQGEKSKRNSDDSEDNEEIGTIRRVHPTDRIVNIKIGAGIAKFNVNKTQEKDIVINAQDVVIDDFKSEINGDTLTISYDPRNSRKGLFSLISLPRWQKTPLIDIDIPENMVFDKFKIDGGVGNYDIEYVNTNSLTMDGGVGKVTIRSSRIDNLKVDAGVGSIDINGDIGEMKLGVGVGSVNVRGSISRDIKVDGGVGGVILDLAGDINNYDVKAESGIGAVRINGEKGDIYKNKGAPYKLRVDGGIGGINVNIR